LKKKDGGGDGGDGGNGGNGGNGGRERNQSDSNGGNGDRGLDRDRNHGVLNDDSEVVIPENETEEETTERLRSQYKKDNVNRRVNNHNRLTENQQLDRLSSTISSLQRALADEQNRNIVRTEVLNRKIDQLTHLIRQLLRQPYRVLGSSNTRNNNTGTNGTGDLQTAVNSAGIEDEVREQSRNCLSKNPRCLHILWLEYNQGVGDKKAAKLFNVSERGQSRYTYSNRNVFWKKVSEMIRSGWNCTVAINKIKHHYGSHLSVTKIIKLMRNDSKSPNGYPRIFDLPS